MAVLNNVKNDVKAVFAQEGLYYKDIADKLGVMDTQVSNAIQNAKRKPPINRFFVEMLEAAGYDIKLTYIKREAPEK